MVKKEKIPIIFSFFFMGSSCFYKGKFIKGSLLLLSEIGFIIYFVFVGFNNLIKLKTLGSIAKLEIWNETLGIYEYQFIDNSMLILLYGSLTIILIGLFFYLYYQNLKYSFMSSNKENTFSFKNNTIIGAIKSEIVEIVNKNYQVILLTIPTLLVIVFTIIPLVFMILIAFTNYDRLHQPPGLLFSWVGLNNFKTLFGSSSVASNTFIKILGWTFVWAIIATFSNYFLGILVASIINRKTIKGKKIWRTIFILTIAVPQFVSLLIISKMFHIDGIINHMLIDLNIIKEAIDWFNTPLNARILVLLINVWIGMPYTLLIMTGILLNVPKEFKESAIIEGATNFQVFIKITMPYLLFITGPYLLTTFIGNINNFNVIYLLTGGGPLTLEYDRAGKTDLLITWLYKLTANESDFKMASVIGIFVFIITVIFALIVFNNMKATKSEDEYQ